MNAEPDNQNPYWKAPPVERWRGVVEHCRIPPHFKELRLRWLDDEGKNRPLVADILSAIKRDEDFSHLLAGLRYIEEVENGRDLRGINFSGERLLKEELDDTGHVVGYRPINCRATDFSYALMVSCDLRGALFGQFVADCVSLLPEGGVIESFAHDVMPESSTGHPCTFFNTEFTSANLEDANFVQCDCTMADFTSAEMTDCSLEFAACFNARFSSTNMSRVNMRSAKFGGAQFDHVVLEGAQVDHDTDFGRRIDGFPDDVADTCRQVKMLFRDAGLYSLEDDYFHAEMRSRRVQRVWWNPLRWLEFVFVDMTCGYGVRPTRVFAWIATTILGCALVYWATDLPRNASEPGLKASLADCLYFSMVTFTTVGFGDWYPNTHSALKFLASCEALFGTSLVSLAIVTFARKALRT